MLSPIEKYRRYKKLFKIQNSPTLELFESLFNSSFQHLEVSQKITTSSICPCRFNLWYHTDIFQHLHRILAVLKKTAQISGNQINDEPFYDLFQKLSLGSIEPSRIKEVLYGVDLRENIEDSRVKIWLNISDHVEDPRETFGLSDSDQDMIRLLNGNLRNNLLIGMDFRLNGKTKLKRYLWYPAEDLKETSVQEQMDGLFSKNAMSLAERSSRIHITSQDDLSKVFHFQPYNSEDFISHIAHEKTYETYQRCTDIGFRLNVISLSENEIKSNNISTINLYF